MLFFKEPVSVHAKVFVLTIVAVGLPIIFYSVLHAVSRPDLNWLYLAGLTAAVTSLPVRTSTELRLGRESVWITFADMFVFMAIFFFGPEVAVVVAVTEAIAFNLYRRVKGFHRQLFNLGQIAMTAFLAGHVFYLVRGVAAPLDPAGVGSPLILLIQALGCGLYYFLLTSGMVARAAAFCGRRPFDRVWSGNLRKLYAPLAGAMVGAGMFLYVN